MTATNYQIAHAEAKAHVSQICAGHLYTAGKGKGYNLYITKGTLSLGRAGELAFKGIDKRTARRICKEHGATPHNF